MTDTDNVVKVELPVSAEKELCVTVADGGGGAKLPDPGSRGELGPGDGLEKDLVDNESPDPVVSQPSLVTNDNHAQPGNDSSVNGKRKRHRRKAKGGSHHRKKWKPYNKLTWEERKVLDEREERRACMRREERFASGQPMAPYNTTQFLMEQHDTAGPIIDTHARHRSSRDRDGSLSYESGSDDGDSSLDDEETFLEREFTEAYESEHAERLQRMTKEELVREYLELETKNEKLEKSLRKVNALAVGANNNVARMSVLETEILRLKQENSNLLAENDGLKSGMTVDNPGAASA